MVAVPEGEFPPEWSYERVQQEVGKRALDLTGTQFNRLVAIACEVLAYKWNLATETLDSTTGVRT